MVDLQSQYQKIMNDVNQGIQAVLDSSAYVNGPAVQQFRGELEAYLGVKHVIPCANGTDALQIAMMALGLKPGDEVITADFTFAATVEVIALLGLTPVLVDVDPDTFNIDPDAMEAAITEKTKAIVPVHLFGQCANMDRIMDIARANNLYVIEDTAQAIGAQYTGRDGAQYAGTIGHFGTTSFFPSKNLGCYGDGGALFTNDDELADNARAMANHGMRRRYYHDEVGVNSRLDSVQAAVLSVKLKQLDEYAASRNAAADAYDAAFADNDKLTTPTRSEFSNHVFHQYTLKTEGVDRFAMQEYLMEQGIPAMVYYPVALHAQKAYADERYNEDDFKVTNRLCEQVISLPMHTELDEEQIAHITNHVNNFTKN